MSTATTFRRFQSDDLPELLRIQQANLFDNLTPKEREDGYQTIEYTPDQFIEMDEDVPLVVADMGENVLGGYLCGASPESCREVPLLAHMMTLYGEITFQRRPLSEYKSYVYGPVCIDRACRGRGVLDGLYAELLNLLKGRYELGVLFVAEGNPRSLNAHERKLGHQNLTVFEFGGKQYHLLVFSIAG